MQAANTGLDDSSALQAEMEDLRARLHEAEQTLEAIRRGDVDAVVVSGSAGEKIFTLEGADHAYRIMIEAMDEGAIIASPDGVIQYCNRSFTRMMELPLEQFLGRSILSFADEAALPQLQALFSAADGRRSELTLLSAAGKAVEVYLSAKPLDVAGGGNSIYLVAMDISERREAELKLRDAKIKYQSIFENASEGIFQISIQGQFIGANPAMARIYGYAGPAALLEAMNRGSNALYLASGRKALLFDQLRERGFTHGFESEVSRADHAVIWVSENIHPVHDVQGTLQYYEGNVVDVTERKLYESQLERQANYDPLTGLANRRLLHRLLQDAIESAGQGQHQVTVAYIDLDNFKLINDGLGHNFGDRLLIEVGERLKQCLQRDDTVARQGGDEFVLILDRSDEQAVLQTMRSLLSTIAEPLTLDGVDLNVTCSIGFSVFPSDGLTADALLKNADAAMYQAKALGRNNVHAFTEKLNREISRKLSLESALRHALKREELSLNYQPQMSFTSGMIVGAEALLRWRYGEADEKFAPEFVPIAEETGLIVPIGEWALRTACMQCRSWAQRSGRPLRVSVNLSPRQFREKSLVSMVAGVLAETGLSPDCLDLELTESLVMHNMESAIATMRELRDLGVHISIDDFGVGYSSLSYLKKFSITGLKIDKSFVHDIVPDDGSSGAISKTIINLAKGMHLRVVAEGVESKMQLDFLRSHGCDEYQGFLLSKAVPAATFLGRFVQGISSVEVL